MRPELLDLGNEPLLPSEVCIWHNLSHKDVTGMAFPVYCSIKSGTACLLLRNFFIGVPPYLATIIWLFKAKRERALNNIFITFYKRQYTDVVHEIFTITQSKTII